jgi:hypothetical protein
MCVCPAAKLAAKIPELCRNSRRVIATEAFLILSGCHASTAKQNEEACYRGRMPLRKWITKRFLG